jgi:hypothetical protein
LPVAESQQFTVSLDLARHKNIVALDIHLRAGDFDLVTLGKGEPLPG